MSKRGRDSDTDTSILNSNKIETKRYENNENQYNDSLYNTLLKPKQQSGFTGERNRRIGLQWIKHNMHRYPVFCDKFKLVIGQKIDDTLLTSIQIVMRKALIEGKSCKEGGLTRNIICFIESNETIRERFRREG